MKKKVCVFLPLYNELKPHEKIYINNLIKEVSTTYNEFIDVIISDNSRTSLHSEFKQSKAFFLVNKNSRKNMSIFNSLDIIENYEYLVILDPDDKIILDKLINIINKADSDIVQTRWIEKGRGKRYLFGERLANYCTINSTALLRKAFLSTDIWNVTAADDYALNLAILNIGGKFKKNWMDPFYIYDRNNDESVSNRLPVKKFDMYFDETMKVLDFNIKNSSYKFKPRYLYLIKIKSKYTDVSYRKTINMKLKSSKYYVWFNLIDTFKWKWKK